jgi:hypothetical protein
VDRSNYLCVMPGLVPGIHVLSLSELKDVDGRDEPGHDGSFAAAPAFRRQRHHQKTGRYAAAGSLSYQGAYSTRPASR